MSSTKWREAIAALIVIPVNIAVKFVDAPEMLNIRFQPWPVGDGYVDSGNGHIFLLSIEWLDILPVEEVREGVAIAGCSGPDGGYGRAQTGLRMPTQHGPPCPALSH